MKPKTWVYIITGTLVTALVASVIVLAVLLVQAQNSDERENYRGLCHPLVIAHRGASGYVPEHTLGAYALAITMGADYVEPDLVITSDGHLIARHDNQLGITTDVGQRPGFASRFRTQSVDGFISSGWFTEDFTLAEIKTLRAIERIPGVRPGNARMDYAFDVPTFQEIVDLVKSMEQIEQRIIGIYPEIKHPTHFQRLGLAMEPVLVEELHRNGYRTRDAPVFIQSFEVNNLKQLKNMTELPLLQLFSAARALQPFDQLVSASPLTYGDMATPEGLREVATYAHAVGPDKSYIIPRTTDNRLGNVTSFVEDAHALGLEVHPYTFRAENTYLPEEFKSEDTAASAIGNFTGELQAFLNTGIDGLFVDQPDALVRLRGSCS